MTPEHALQNEIRNALAGRCLLFRANVGQGWAGVVQEREGRTLTLLDPRPFSTGLPTGFPDLFGMTFDGRFLAIEVKTARVKGKTKAGKVSEDQSSFIAAVLRAGGRAGVARSVVDAVAILELP